jgi:hypothetical protein
MQCIRNVIRAKIVWFRAECRFREVIAPDPATPSSDLRLDRSTQGRQGECFASRTEPGNILLGVRQR